VLEVGAARRLFQGAKKIEPPHAAPAFIVENIVYVDESVNEFESNIIWRAADLLGVSSRQRIELRQRIAADRAALA